MDFCITLKIRKTTWETIRETIRETIQETIRKKIRNQLVSSAMAIAIAMRLPDRRSGEMSSNLMCILMYEDVSIASIDASSWSGWILESNERDWALELSGMYPTSCMRTIRTKQTFTFLLLVPVLALNKENKIRWLPQASSVSSSTL